MAEKKIVIRKMLLEESEDGTGQIMLQFQITLPKSEKLISILDQIKHLEGVRWVSSE
ncbi:hypothetical protein D3C77_592430 [compost metagenome]